MRWQVQNEMSTRIMSDALYGMKNMDSHAPEVHPILKAPYHTAGGTDPTPYHTAGGTDPTPYPDVCLRIVPVSGACACAHTVSRLYPIAFSVVLGPLTLQLRLTLLVSQCIPRLPPMPPWPA